MKRMEKSGVVSLLGKRAKLSIVNTLALPFVAEDEVGCDAPAYYKFGGAFG